MPDDVNVRRDRVTGAAAPAEVIRTFNDNGVGCRDVDPGSIMVVQTSTLKR